MYVHKDCLQICICFTNKKFETTIDGIIVLSSFYILRTAASCFPLVACRIDFQPQRVRAFGKQRVDYGYF